MPRRDEREHTQRTELQRHVYFILDPVALLTFDDGYQDRVSWCGTVHPRLCLSLYGYVRETEDTTVDKKKEKKKTEAVWFPRGGRERVGSRYCPKDEWDLAGGKKKE